MKMRYFSHLGCFLFAGAVFLTPAAIAGEKAVMSQIDMVRQSIRDRVRATWQDRFEKMPYLDKGFVRSVISVDKVLQRDAFVVAGPKSLSALLDRAVKVHTPLRVARERISLAHRRILVAFRELLPEVKVVWQERDGDLSTTPFNSMSYKIASRIPLFRGGILWNTLLKEKQELQAFKKEYEAVMGDLVNKVSAAFFEFNRAAESLKVRRAVTDKVRRYTNISKQKFEQEIIAEIENLNVQSLASQVQYDLETAKQEVELAELELQKLLDLDIDDDVAVVPLYDVEEVLRRGADEEDLSSPDEELYREWQEEREPAFEGSVRVPDLSELVDLAYENRPELQVEAARLQSARLEERIKWGKLLPRADLLVEIGKLAEAFDVNSVNPSLRKDLRIQLELTWNALGNEFGYELENRELAPSVTQFTQGNGSQFTRNTIEVGLFSGLDKLAAAKEAEVEKLDQIVELEEKEKKVILEVKQAYFDYQKARIQVRSQIQRSNYRRRLVRLLEFRLEKNEIQISEYLQGEMELIQDLGNLHKALADYFTAKAKLNHAIGVSNYFPIEEWYGT